MFSSLKKAQLAAHLEGLALAACRVARQTPFGDSEVAHQYRSIFNALLTNLVTGAGTGDRTKANRPWGFQKSTILQDNPFILYLWDPCKPETRDDINLARLQGPS